MLPRARREQRERASWRPLRRARRAIDSALRRVETSGRLIDASLRFAAGPPVETSRRLYRLANWIGEADARLERAARDVGESFQQAALALEHLDAPLLLLLTATSLRWVEAAGRLAQVSARLTHATALLTTNPRTWADLTTAAAPAQTKPPSWPHAPSCLVRHQPFVTATTADAAREISRGRAPPPFQSALSDRRN